MSSENKLRPIVQLSAVIVASLTLAIAGGTSAFAAAPTVTATPSSDLPDGASISVSAAGFAAGEKVSLAECAVVEDGTAVCNGPEGQIATADADGNVAPVSLTAHKTFQGYDQAGEPWGTVDCSTAPSGCVIGAINESGTTRANTPITFQ